MFRVDVSTGFEELTLIEHDTRIYRSLQLGERLIAISSNQISAHAIDDPTQELDRLNYDSVDGIAFAELRRYVSPSMRDFVRHLAERREAAAGETNDHVFERLNSQELVPERSVPSSLLNRVREGRSLRVRASTESTNDEYLAQSNARDETLQFEWPSVNR